jgi:hypothetical protein
MPLKTQQKVIEIKDDLFYSINEQLLFWVAGYTDNTDNVVDLTTIYLERARALADLTKSDIKNIGTREINTSRRYKRMRVFYIKTIIIPENAFSLGKDWDMWKWLEN